MLPVDLSKDLGTDMAWQRVSHWLKVLAHNEGMDQRSFLRSTTSSFLATSYPGISHPLPHAASPPSVMQRHALHQQQARDSTSELQTLQARKISKMQTEIANLKDELERAQATADVSSSATGGSSMRAVFEEQLSKSKRACDALMKERALLLKQLDAAQESGNALAAAVDGYKVQIAQLNRKLELESQRSLNSPAVKSQAATDAKIAEAHDATAHLLQQVKQLQVRLNEQQQQLQLEAQQKQTALADSAAAIAAAQRQNDTLRLQNAQLQLQFQELQNTSIASMASAPSDAPLALLNSELLQLVETRGAAIAALQSEMASSVEASLGSKAADIISKERKRIEPHVTSLVQAVRTSEARVHALQAQLKEAQDQLLQLQHSVMVTNLTQSQGSRRPSSASSRGVGVPISETEAASRLLQAQTDSLKMQVKELESELRVVAQELIASRAAAENFSMQLDAAKREASDSQALVVSLKTLAQGGDDAMSCATENAALKQELSRSQDTIQRLMAQEAVSAESISSLEHELDAKMDQIDELKGQVMSSLLKNREVTLEVEAAQNEVRDKEQELRSMQNYIASLESDGGRGGEGDGQGSFFLAENERLAAEGERSAVWCLYETRLVFVMRVMLCEHGVSDHFLTTFDQLIIQTNGEWNPNIRLLKFKSDWNS
jgi:chromosome segregation ATPase